MNGDCWLWRGGKRRNGYGFVQWNGKFAYAHRAFWEMANGPIPDGLFVCHHCDTPLCVRPDHLFLGTADDNAKDMAQKGRAASGERHHLSVVTATQVIAMRDDYRAGGITQQEVAIKYGLPHQTVSRILKGRRWGHIQGAIVGDRRHFTPQARTARHRPA